MGKHKNTTRGDADAQMGVSPTPSYQRGEAGDTDNAVYGLRDDVASLEEGLSQKDTLSKMPFKFLQPSQLPSEWSIIPEHQQDHLAYEDWICYCIHIRVILGEGGGDQPQPSHAWIGSLIVDMFQEDLEEQITKAVVLAPGKAILFFRRWSFKEGLPLGNICDVGFTLMGPIYWVGRTAYVEVTINTVQECHWAIEDAVVEERTKTRRPGHPHGTTKVMKTPTVACNIEKWMWGVEGDACKVEARNSDMIDCRPAQRNAHSQHAGQDSQWHRRQGRPQFPRDTSGGSPSSGGGSSNWGSNQSSQQSSMMRASGESNQPVWPGRGLRVKVSLPIFKDEKIKDVLTYHSWW